MKTLLVLLAVIAGAAACSSTTSGASCADVSGNWKLNSVFTDGDCDKTRFGSDDDSTITLTKDADGTVSIVLPGSTGSCPGTFTASTCKFTAVCEITDSKGAKVASVNADWTFSGKSFSGSEIGALAAGAGVGGAGQPSCKANFKDTGTKL